MNKVLLLLKKDITLDKMYLMISIILSFGIPIFLVKSLDKLQITKGMDLMGILLSSFYCFFMMFSKIGLIEDKYKSEQYILISPVSRKMIVLSKYILFLLIFVVCILAYSVDSCIFGQLNKPEFSSVSTAFLFISIFMGIYIPLEFKVGYENVKFYLMLIIILTPICVGALGKGMTQESAQKVSAIFESISPFFTVFAVVIIVISFIVSCRIYEKKDL